MNEKSQYTSPPIQLPFIAYLSIKISLAEYAVFFSAPSTDRWNNSTIYLVKFLSPLDGSPAGEELIAQHLQEPTGMKNPVFLSRNLDRSFWTVLSALHLEDKCAAIAVGTWQLATLPFQYVPKVWRCREHTVILSFANSNNPKIDDQHRHA